LLGVGGHDNFAHLTTTATKGEYSYPQAS
jgi:hypothetical protein